MPFAVSRSGGSEHWTVIKSLSPWTWTQLTTDKRCYFQPGQVASEKSCGIHCSASWREKNFRSGFWIWGLWVWRLVEICVIPKFEKIRSFVWGVLLVLTPPEGESIEDPHTCKSLPWGGPTIYSVQVFFFCQSLLYPELASPGSKNPPWYPPLKVLTFLLCRTFSFQMQPDVKPIVQQIFSEKKKVVWSLYLEAQPQGASPSKAGFRAQSECIPTGKSIDELWIWGKVNLSMFVVRGVKPRWKLTAYKFLPSRFIAFWMWMCCRFIRHRILSIPCRHVLFCQQIKRGTPWNVLREL